MDARDTAIRQATVAYMVTGFGFVSMAFLAVYFSIFWTPKRITCTVLVQTYGDRAYDQAIKLLPTNPQLDGNRNGIPCENLKT